MNSDKVICLDIITTHQPLQHEKPWDQVLMELNSVQVQIIFASTKSFFSTSTQLRKDLEEQLRIPAFFFDNMHLQSNGFSGHDVLLDQNGQLESQRCWSRFIVKQTNENLRPRATFTPHNSVYPSQAGGWNPSAGVHEHESIQHGWEWYEMGFFTNWHHSGKATLLCFDLPAKARSNIESNFCMHAADLSNPYAIFSVVSGELLRLYDDSVWSIRNHISQWESRRLVETDYILLHEIARHGIHVKETLSVAIRSLNSIRKDHEKTRPIWETELKNRLAHWDKFGNRFEFQIRFLEDLLERSEANNARIQNEITLAFNVAAQNNSRIQVQIGEEARREASAMKAIAIVTMTFLPATFVSTIFGMAFFDFGPSGDDQTMSFTVSRHFWIYWAFSIPMTFATLGSWICWNRWRQPIR